MSIGQPLGRQLDHRQDPPGFDTLHITGGDAMSAWVLIGLALALPFSGNPTYLACEFPSPDKAPPIEVKIARSYRAVTLTIPSTGHVEQQRAVVSASSISFDSPLPYGNVNYSINRADLSIGRTTTGPSITATVTKGQCRLQTAPKLAF